MKLRIAPLLASGILGGLAAGAFAQLTPGNLVVLRIGDGSGPLSSAATPDFVDQYTTAGAYVNSVALPTADNGVQLALTNSGSASSEGGLTLSADGMYLLLAGYDATPGTTKVASSSVTRVIGRIGMNGAVDTSTGLGTYFVGNNVRGVAGLDGTNFWAVGATSGVVYSNLGGADAAQVSTTSMNNRRARVYGGNVYFTTSSSSAGALGLYMIPGEPTSGAVDATNVIDTGDSSSPFDFVFQDANTVYIADDNTDGTGGLQKWVNVGGVWSMAYAGYETIDEGMRGLASDGTTLYAITDDNKLVAATDNGTSFKFRVLATASTNEVFRGVAFLPVQNQPQLVEPNAYSVGHGKLIGGDLSSLQFVDQNYLELGATLTTNAAQPPVQLVVSGVSPSSTASTLEFDVVGHVNSINVAQTIELFDWTTNAYVRVDTRAASTSDGTTTITVTGANDYVQPGTNLVQARVSFRTTGVVPRITWDSFTDETIWKITP